MKKYYVIATRWSDETKSQIRTIVGEFDEWMLAKLFCDAYSAEFMTEAHIVEVRG